VPHLEGKTLVRERERERKGGAAPCLAPVLRGKGREKEAGTGWGGSHEAEGRRGPARLSATWRRVGGPGDRQSHANGGGGRRSGQGRDGALTGGPGATVPRFKSIQTGQIYFKRN
jgi:hypothetical protein